MSASLAHLRRRFPWLTPPFVEEDRLLRRPDTNKVPPIIRRVPDPTEIAINPIETPAPVVPPVPLGAPPIMIRRNNKGRPLEAIGGADPLERDESLYEAQQGYKAPFSKKDFLLSSLSSLLQGGLPNVAGNAIGFADPNYRKQASMGADMDLTRGRIQSGLVRRKLQNDWLNDESLRGYRDAQAQDLLTREPKQNFGWIPDPENPEGADIYGPLQPGAKRLVRKPTRSDPAFNISPGQERVVIGPDGQPRVVYSRPDRPKDEKADVSTFTNQAIEQNIRDAERERDQIGANLGAIPREIPTAVQGVTQPNPLYLDAMRRYRALDDKVRDWRTKIKPPLTRSASRSTKKWSASRWAQANPDKDLSAAKAEARRRGFEVIE